MGLDIRSSVKDDKFGSYGRLHILRRWVYEYVEGNKKEDVDLFYTSRGGSLKMDICPELLNHSDCDGGYISFLAFGIKRIISNGELLIGDMDKLAKELLILKKKYYETMPIDVKEVFDDFCSYVFYSEDFDIEDKCNVLEFN